MINLALKSLKDILLLLTKNLSCLLLFLNKKFLTIVYDLEINLALNFNIVMLGDFLFK